jgi:proton-coupled amino acid transporter
LFRSKQQIDTEPCFILVALAIAVPKLGPIISLVGSVCFSTLGLFCPAVIETVTYWGRGLGWRLWKNIFIVLFSLVALLTGSYASILEIIDEY